MTLKSFRTTTGISVKELSDKTGISVSALYAYEKENALPSREVAVKLADVYKIPLYDLMPLVKNEKGVTRAAFEEQAEDFKAKYEPDKKSTPQTKETPKPTPRKEETRDPVILETTLTLEPPLTPQVKSSHPCGVPRSRKRCDESAPSYPRQRYQRTDHACCRIRNSRD